MREGRESGLVETIIKKPTYSLALGFIQCILFFTFLVLFFFFNTCNSDISWAKDGIGICVWNVPLCKCMLERDLYIYYVGYFCIIECSELRITDLSSSFSTVTYNPIILPCLLLALRLLLLRVTDLYMIDTQGGLSLHMQCSVLQILCR